MGPKLNPIVVARLADFLAPVNTITFNRVLSAWKEGQPKLMITELLINGAYNMREIGTRPLFLQPNVFADAKKYGLASPRLQFYQGMLQEVGVKLSQEEGQYDIVDMSNILDLLNTVEESVPLLTEVIKCIKPGGVLLSRWANTPPFLKNAFTRVGLDVDDKLSDSLMKLESSCWMTEVCVGRAS